MAKKKSQESTYGGGPSYSAKSIKAAKARGEEVPRTDTKADYREDMAQIDRVEKNYPMESRRAMRKGGDVFANPIPKSYYEHFDRGAARYAQKQGNKRKIGKAQGSAGINRGRSAQKSTVRRKTVAPKG